MSLVGLPTLFQRAAVRVVVALIVSIFFGALQLIYQPYQHTEHNTLAGLASAQISGTLLLIALQAVGLELAPVLGFVCIMLNVITVPLVVAFNARRVKHRKEILAAFLVEREQAQHEETEKHPARFFNASHFIEFRQAGKKSEFAVFSALFQWMDAALTHPVQEDRWGQILFALENLPLEDPAYGDAQFGTLVSSSKDLYSQ